MNKKWSKKKKIITAVIIVAVVALAAAVLYIALKPEDPIETEIYQVQTGDITETFDTTAIVQSSNQGNFLIYDGVKIKEVNVRVGDNVKKGDVLATFDTTSLNALLSEKREAYNAAQQAYNDYLDGSFSAKSQQAEIDKQIATLEKEIVNLEKIVSEEKNNKNDNVSSGNAQASKDELAELREALKETLGNNKLADAMVDRLLSSDSATSQMVSAIKGLLSTATIDMSAIQSMTNGLMSENEQHLLEKELQLVQLKVQSAMLSAQSGDTLKTVYKTIADSSYDAYQEMATQVNSLNGGWIAAEDGFIREVNIKAGETYVSETASSAPQLDMSSILASVTSGNYDITNIISSLTGSSNKGMVVEYYPLEATFEVSKYDISKIYMDQKVTVSTVDGKKFDATVNYISAVADSSSSAGLNINSLMGGGAASNTLTAKVEIHDADRSVIIGMDVELSAALETKKDVLLIPVESIQYDNESGYYVFVYDAEEKVINRKTVVVGLFDGANYEVLEGLSEGDQIVRAPRMKMEDGMRVVPKG